MTNIFIHIRLFFTAAILIYTPLISLSLNASETVNFSVKNKLPIPKDCFTQGFTIESGFIYLSCGMFNRSRVIKMDMSGKVLVTKHLPKKVFAEGLTLFNNTLYVLTWKNHITYTLNKNTLEIEKQISLNGEGWGLSSRDNEFLLSDGSNAIHSLDSNTFTKKRSYFLKDGNNIKLNQLNELENIKNLLFANQWKTRKIHLIPRSFGQNIQPIAEINISDEKAFSEEFKRGVLNGIAYDEKTQCLWITGKNWNKAYALSLETTPDIKKLSGSSFDCL